MDNLTHALTAVALSRAGLNRLTPYATLSLVVGSNLPDLDIVTWLEGSTAYLKYHRGITHSLVGVTVLAVGLAATVLGLSWAVARARGRTPPQIRPWKLLAVCWIGTASHLLLDFTNSYGVRPFLPFNEAWYGWDIMFIIDPVLLLVLLAALLLPALFRLVAEEVGTGNPDHRWGAVLGLVFMGLWWGLRDVTHRRALDRLDSGPYAAELPVSVGAYPSPVNPFFWTGIVETASAFHVVPVDTLGAAVVPDRVRLFRKPQRNLVFEAALKTETAQVFSDFARHAWLTSHDAPNGFVVEIRDLRFLSATRRRQGFVVRVEMDSRLEVLSEEFSFSGPPGGFPNRYSEELAGRKRR